MGVAILVILRNILQGMRRPGMPLFCSCLELIGKVIFALWLVPAFGYVAVCVCEPVTWVICCVVIAVAVFAIRGPPYIKASCSAPVALPQLPTTFVIQAIALLTHTV